MAGLSKLILHSVGTVGNNKPLDSKVIEVLPNEVHPMTDGAVTDNYTAYSAKGVDSSGQAYEDTLAQTATVSATWLPMGGSNRTTAPDVRRGEQVILYKYADQDKYWWATLMDDMSLRKLETVIYAFSGSSDESATSDASNTYFFEISTHQKLIHVHTSNANGEPFVYDIQIDAGNGNIRIADDANNLFLFDSANAVIRMMNSAGAYYEVNQKDVNVFVPETFNLMAKTGQMMFTESLTIETQETNIKSATTNHLGDFNETGAFGLNGDMTTAAGSGGGTPGTGKIRIKGDATLLGNMDIQGNATAVTLEASESITAPNLKYN